MGYPAFDANIQRKRFEVSEFIRERKGSMNFSVNEFWLYLGILEPFNSLFKPNDYLVIQVSNQDYGRVSIFKQYIVIPTLFYGVGNRQYSDVTEINLNFIDEGENAGKLNIKFLNNKDTLIEGLVCGFDEV